ncbi:uncharacterized protein LOC133913826 [Phragmites australis]|uniref:uncharacterized protein LOC133913826 n=1 Tax=Phragmites australis TaxID=29695 RepID=UPI002D773A08|nr:uncharacterized protein LOC133913826 [Phragmites australis]
MAADHALSLAASSCPGSLHSAAAYYVGLSCALAALHRALGAQGRVTGWCDLGATRRGCRWSRVRELALREKVGALDRNVEELRRRRAEDARANEKVAGIFAAHEQRWLAERKSLRRQVHAVVAAARARESKREEEAEELRRQMEEQRCATGLKDEALEREGARREDAEERLRVAEQVAEELRERARKDAAEHAAELRKHKAAFVELASAQRQLEADLARAARLADSSEAELKTALERRDEAAAAAADLSAEAARLRRDAEHKDKILSAMLRKSKIDMEDREMLVREVKMCKARRKQAELEAERWRKMWESRGHRRGSRSSARSDHPGCSDKLAHDANDTKILFVDHVAGDDKRAPPAKELTTIERVDRYPSHVDDKPAVEWFQMETEKYTAMIKNRHKTEVEAFTEQLLLKGEKLEAFRWRAVSMDVEATRLRCRIQELEGRLAQHEQHSAGLEALLLDREKENISLKEKLETLQAQALGIVIYAADDQDDDTCDHCIPCSPVKIERTMPGEADRRSSGARHPEGTEVTNPHHSETKLDEPVSPDDHKDKAFDVEATEAHGVLVPVPVPVPDHAHAEAPTLLEQERHNVPRQNSYRSEIEEEKEVYTDPGNAHSQTSTSSSQEVTSGLALVVVAPEQKSSAGKTDIHALAVSHKIKRLKQQLLVLGKLAAEGKEEAAATKPSGSRQHPRTRYQTMMSFLSKHVKRYQSLDDKIDGLCARMEESKRSVGRERRGAGEQKVALGQFLGETFQLQRLMVATGQKLLETQSRITPSLVVRDGGGEDGMDMKRLMDVAGALLRDVQRGLEVRIARIIGDLEGTLTFHGILHTAR